MGKQNKKILIIIGLVLTLFISSCSDAAVVTKTQDVNIVEPVDDYGVEVSIQDYNGDIISFFLTYELHHTNLTTEAFKNNQTVFVNTTTNCLVGDAFDIWDNNTYFQGIITAVTANSISFTPQLDTDYTDIENTDIKCGEWNMNVDGSTTSVEFHITPPHNKTWDIESVGFQCEDNSAWDISTFCSRTALTNGFTVNIHDGYDKELFLIYNNAGFDLRGFIVREYAKAPSGVYGFTANLAFAEIYGAIPYIDGNTEDYFGVKIADDLTTQDQIAMTLRGHYKDI